MGSAMAVNFANLFMSELETRMLDQYEKENGIRPTCWLRYIDDIFFVFRKLHFPWFHVDFIIFGNITSDGVLTKPISTTFSLINLKQMVLVPNHLKVEALI